LLYVFPNFSAYFGKVYEDKVIMDSSDLTQLLLKEEKMAVVPGTNFGSPDHLRISYASSTDNINRGLDRLEELLSKIR